MERGKVSSNVSGETWIKKRMQDPLGECLRKKCKGEEEEITKDTERLRKVPGENEYASIT